MNYTGPSPVRQPVYWQSEETLNVRLQWRELWAGTSTARCITLATVQNWGDVFVWVCVSPPWLSTSGGDSRCRRQVKCDIVDPAHAQASAGGTHQWKPWHIEICR